MNMTGTGMTGTRQQVERWIEESQYLLGRVIPSVFDDNQRLRERSAAADAECDRMREEIAVLRREVHELQSELVGLRGQHDQLKGEQGAVTESLSRAVHHLNELMQPINEMVARLHVVPPTVESAYQSARE
jgi:chromosome segregation ATPase